MERSQKEYYLNEQMRAIQKELGERDEFKNEIQELEEQLKAQEDARRGARADREGAPQAQDDVADERRGDRRAQLHRLDALAALEGLQGRARRHRRGRARAERGPLRAREAEGAHPRVPRRAGAGREDEGPDPVPGRPARRRQDLARALDRARHRPRLRAHQPRRRARRGRDPRPPPHLHRRAAGQDHPGPQEGGLRQPDLPARRGRQDVDGLPRRPVVGAARGARPRAEPHLQRPLPRPRLRPVARHVRLHRERAAPHPAAAPGPHGDHPAPGLHREREARDRARVPGAEAARGERPRGASTSSSRTPRSSRSSATTRASRACAASSARSPRSAARSRARW